MLLKKLSQKYRYLVKARKKGIYRINRYALTASLDARNYLRINIPFRVGSEEGNSYQVIFSVAPDAGVERLSQILENGYTKVYCNCPDFKFRLAYALQKRYQIVLPHPDLKLALTLPPRSTNPWLKTRLCKHTIMVYRILQKYKITELIEEDIQTVYDWQGG
ncbi:MAG: hypothetical protein QXM12_02830 [Nitrososphaerota archaeon]